MPAWIPASALIDYVTGALLISGGVRFLHRATWLGAWILLLVVAIHGPVLGEAQRQIPRRRRIIPAVTFAPGAASFLFTAAVAAAAAWIGLFVMRLIARRELRRKENL